mmetsp:Transcript_62517/g.120451  ORF Transcript_62517/g.120451 Transcript_62517/m.120451 type:complete len:301 (+) Transcript_62517:146-1048(+)
MAFSPVPNMAKDTSDEALQTRLTPRRSSVESLANKQIVRASVALLDGLEVAQGKTTETGGSPVPSQNRLSIEKVENQQLVTKAISSRSSTASTAIETEDCPSRSQSRPSLEKIVNQQIVTTRSSASSTAAETEDLPRSFRRSASRPSIVHLESRRLVTGLSDGEEAAETECVLRRVRSTDSLRSVHSTESLRTIDSWKLVKARMIKFQCHNSLEQADMATTVAVMAKASDCVGKHAAVGGAPENRDVGERGSTISAQPVSWMEHADGQILLSADHLTYVGQNLPPACMCDWPVPYWLASQ